MLQQKLITMVVSVEKAVIARLQKSGQKFEILVDPEKALEVKRGKDIETDDLLAAQEVYEDAHKGTRISPEILNKTFGTTDIRKIANKIIRNGELQLTTEQRKKMIEDKKRAIANIISKQSIDPQTNAPHPPQRIERAMEQAKVQISLEKTPEEHVDEVIKAIRSIIPISIEKVKLSIRSTPEFSARISNEIRKWAKPSSENWGADGSYSCTVEIPAGLQTEIYNKLNSITHGQIQIKLIK